MVLVELTCVGLVEKPLLSWIDHNVSYMALLSC